MQKLLPDIRQLSEFYVPQQHGIPRMAHETSDLLTRETPNFIPLTLWPLNTPDLNTVDYNMWLVM